MTYGHLITDYWSFKETRMPVLGKTVLVTGASSGIGEATARALQAQGWTVYATARQPSTLSALAAAGCQTLALDVTDEESMQVAVAAVEAKHGAVDVLINNAGYSQSGALERLTPQQVRAQFETNVFGMLRLTQLVLPGMRKKGGGRIVNLSSMGGKLTFPGGGIYHASKHAVEALSDALRFEVGGFGIDMVIIEPGLIRSNFGNAAVATVARSKDDSSVYADFDAQVTEATKNIYEKGMLAKLGGPPEAVASVIARAVSVARPKTRYRVTFSATLLLTLHGWLSDRAWDAFVGQSFRQPKVR
jgi:NAD(P)-dependent dehydrogenase (short-subunit alcohol dehydrogenase family)